MRSAVGSGVLRWNLPSLQKQPRFCLISTSVNIPAVATIPTVATTPILPCYPSSSSAPLPTSSSHLHLLPPSELVSLFDKLALSCKQADSRTSEKGFTALVRRLRLATLQQLPEFSLPHLSAICLSLLRVGCLRERLLLALSPTIVDRLSEISNKQTQSQLNRSLSAADFPASSSSSVSSDFSAVLDLLFCFRALRLLSPPVVAPLLHSAFLLLTPSPSSLTRLLAAMAALNLPLSSSHPVAIFSSSPSPISKPPPPPPLFCHSAIPKTLSELSDLSANLLLRILPLLPSPSSSAADLVQSIYALTKLLPHSVRFAARHAAVAAEVGGTTCCSTPPPPPLLSNSPRLMPSSSHNKPSFSSSDNNVTAGVVCCLDTQLHSLLHHTSQLHPWEVEVACTALHAASDILEALTNSHHLDLWQRLALRATQCLPQFSSQSFCMVLRCLSAAGVADGSFLSRSLLQLTRMADSFQPNDIYLTTLTLLHHIDPPGEQLWAELMVPLYVQQMRLFDRKLRQATDELFAHACPQLGPRSSPPHISSPFRLLFDVLRLPPSVRERRTEGQQDTVTWSAAGKKKVKRKVKKTRKP
eukprot:GHVS01024968.1.p1 GENE.GHVS01024968.1~~GHVS01024968.1.p1  ORF type:complete len:585 (-),score=130.35 GHVS01024968.1:94-1848(-)